MKQQSSRSTMLSARYPNELATAIRERANRLGITFSELLITGARMAVEETERKEAGA